MEEHRAQLEWEQRLGRAAALAALVSVLGMVAYTVLLQAVVLQDRPDPDLSREALRAFDEHAGAYIAAAVCQGVNYLGLGVVLWYLFRATRYRRREVPSWAVWLVYAGPVLFAVASVLSALDRIDVADQFVSSGVTEGRAGERRAENLADEGAPVSVALGAAGTLATAFALVLVSLNAMRAGLLSRFLGIIGVIVGALYVLPIFGGPLIVQVFWLGALGAVFLGVWPGGRGEAWETCESGTWLTASEQRRRALGEQRDAPDPPDGGPDPPGGEAAEPEQPGEPQHPVSRKRRKKRRG